jgi:PD-(D/E)XK nuclease superfamily
MPEAKPPAYLSASRLATYDRCPAEFYVRYILQVPQRPAVERCYGLAVHAGLEAQFRGEDDELEFLRQWRKHTADCRGAGLFVAPALTDRGLEILDMVRRLGLQGEPEHKFVTIAADLKLPIFGYVDLWADGKIYDFKTSGFGWTQARADREIWQPALYSLAYAEETHADLPTFEYIVLPRAGGSLQRLDATRTPRQVYETLQRARGILQAIEEGQFGCTCGRAEHQVAA